MAFTPFTNQDLPVLALWGGEPRKERYGFEYALALDNTYRVITTV